MPATIADPVESARTFAKVRFYIGASEHVPSPCPRLLLEDDRDARDLDGIKPFIIRTICLAMGYSQAEADAAFGRIQWEIQRHDTGIVYVNGRASHLQFEIISTIYYRRSRADAIAADVEAYGLDGSLIMACDFVTPDCMG